MKKPREMISEHLPTYGRRNKLSANDKAIMKLIEYASNEEWVSNDTPKSIHEVLEVGCGLGVLLEPLWKSGYNIMGADGDENCVRIAGQFAPTIQMDASLPWAFPDNSQDLVIMSHSLEHVNDPLQAVMEAQRVAKWQIFAIPNPTRPEVFCFTNLFRMDYSNYGHLCTWDRSHFRYFLERKAGLEIVKWAEDEVRFMLGPLIRLDKGPIRFIEEKVLTKLFPYYTTSCIVLTRRKD